MTEYLDWGREDEASEETLLMALLGAGEGSFPACTFGAISTEIAFFRGVYNQKDQWSPSIVDLVLGSIETKARVAAELVSRNRHVTRSPHKLRPAKGEERWDHADFTMAIGACLETLKLLPSPGESGGHDALRARLHELSHHLAVDIAWAETR